MAEKLFTPITLGNATIKNRVIFPSMCVIYANEEGYIDDVFLTYVKERARGGIGLIIIPGSPHGKPGPTRPALSDDKYIPGWKKLAEVAHQHGGKLFCQIHPAAMQAGHGYEIDMPSDYSLEGIKTLVASYATCAERCVKAGVDGVEIHGAHAHEVAQFMSSYYNTRTDEYGGNVENRSRFSQEIIKAIKEACGKDYPLIFRVSGSEKVKGGREIGETVEIAKYLEAAGADAIHVSCGMPESSGYVAAPMDVDDCFNVADAAAVKAAVSVPVIAVNRIVDIAQAVEIVENGLADMVAMARGHLADPDLISKYLGLNDHPVRRCVGCNQGCRDAALYKKICCMQNPRLGNETKLNYEKIGDNRKSEKIMIAGAGPAGLEAACDLAERGFRPVVYERCAAPGGLIRLAAKTPFKGNMNSLIDYRVNALKKSNVEIRYGTEVDLALIEKENPDTLILATGSSPVVPQIPGCDSKNVFTGDDIIQGAEIPGKRVALLGGGLIGCEVSEYLAEQGKQVVILETMDNIAKDLNANRRSFMLDRMSEIGIEVHLLTKVLAIHLPDIDVSVKGYRQTLGGFDAVVIAAGRNSVNVLEQAVKSRFPRMNVQVIGDAAKPGFALEAIHQAAKLAASL